MEDLIHKREDWIPVPMCELISPPSVGEKNSKNQATTCPDRLLKSSSKGARDQGECSCYPQRDWQLGEFEACSEAGKTTCAHDQHSRTDPLSRVRRLCQTSADREGLLRRIGEPRECPPLCAHFRESPGREHSETRQAQGNQATCREVSVYEVEAVECRPLKDGQEAIRETWWEVLRSEIERKCRGRDLSMSRAVRELYLACGLQAPSRNRRSGSSADPIGILAEELVDACIKEGKSRSDQNVHRFHCLPRSWSRSPYRTYFRDVTAQIVSKYRPHCSGCLLPAVSTGQHNGVSQRSSMVSSNKERVLSERRWPQARAGCTGEFGHLGQVPADESAGVVVAPAQPGALGSQE